MKKAIMLILAIFCLSNSYSQITNLETGERIDKRGDQSEQGTIQKLKNLAYEKQQKKDYIGAILLYDKVIEIAPNNEINYFQRGHYKYWNKQYEECIKDMNLGLAINPNEPDLYYYRALANIKLNRLETVCKDLKKGNAEKELLKKYCK
jgi:tetratricopeptide (TPR) repeat protein